MNLELPLLISIIAILISIGSIVFKSGSAKEQLRSVAIDNSDIKIRVGRIENKQSTDHERITTLYKKAEENANTIIDINKENTKTQLSVAKIEVLFIQISKDISDIKTSIKHQ